MLRSIQKKENVFFLMVMKLKSWRYTTNKSPFWDKLWSKLTIFYFGVKQQSAWMFVPVPGAVYFKLEGSSST